MLKSLDQTKCEPRQEKRALAKGRCHSSRYVRLWQVELWNSEG